MSLVDDVALDQTAPWAPKVPLAPVPAQPAVGEPKITPETHPRFFSAVGPAPGVKPPEASAEKPLAGDYMAVVRRRESGGNDTAGNGVAFGRYAFTPRTWLGVAAAHSELGLRPEDIWNGEKQDQAMRALTADNARVLREEGLDPSPANLYVTHFLGTGGGPKFLRAMQADPSFSAASLFPLEARYNPTIFFRGGDPRAPRSLGDVYALMTRDFGSVALDASQTKSVENASTQIASSATSDAVDEASLPPLPADVKPIESPAPSETLPPLPPGFKLIAPENAYRQDVGGYESEAAKDAEAPGFWSKLSSPEAWFGPGGSWKNLGGLIGPGAAPGHEDDFSKAYLGAEYDLARKESEFGAGLASGVAQAPIGLAEAVPGDIGQGAAEANKLLQRVGSPEAQTVGTVAAQLVPIERGAEAAGAAARGLVEEGPRLASWARGAGEGALGGATAGLMTPTGETDPGKRAEEKIEGAAIGGALGAAAGGALPGVAGAAKWGAKEWSVLTGATARKAAEDARRLAEELRSGVDAETGKAMTADATLAKLAQIDRLNAQAQAAKDEATATAQRAKIEEHASGPVSTPEALGEQIHQTAVADMEALRAERRAKSGFDEAVRSDGRRPSVPTARFIDDARRMEEETRNPQLKSALAQFRRSLTNAADVKGQPAVKAVSISQAREILQTLNGEIENLDVGGAHRLAEIRDVFLDNLERTHPKMKAARERYAEMSRPLDVYERTGALKKAVMEDPYSGAATMDPTRIKAAITGRTAAGAEALRRLVERNPVIRDSVRNVLRGELYGAGAAARTPTASQLRSFLAKNRLTLEKTSLYDEFAAIRPSLEAVEAAPRRAAETAKSIESLARNKATALAARRDLRQLQIEMNEPKNTPAQIVAAAERTAKSLYGRGAFTEAQYQRFTGDLRDAQRRIAEAKDEEARHRAAVALAIKVGVAAGAAGAAGAVGREFIQHRIYPHG
jgi:hypothetical protein